jgi:hypothetical protein
MTRYLLLPALLLLGVSAQMAWAQTPAQSRAPVTQPAAPISVAQAPALAPAATPQRTGLCQCISDFKNLDFTCPGSAEACASQCGRLYAYRPDALCTSAGQ